MRRILFFNQASGVFIEMEFGSFLDKNLKTEINSEDSSVKINDKRL
jgi:hypothetical protein